MTRTESAKVAARARWGPPKVINIRDLSTEQRRLVLALVEAARTAQADKAA